MNLKKAAAILVSCALAGALLVGCGGQQAAQKEGGQDSKDVIKTWKAAASVRWIFSKA